MVIWCEILDIFKQMVENLHLIDMDTEKQLYTRSVQLNNVFKIAKLSDE